MKENLVITFLLISFLSVQAQERSTKGADNGYAWNSMSNPLIIFDDSKYNLLVSSAPACLNPSSHYPLEIATCE